MVRFLWHYVKQKKGILALNVCFVVLQVVIQTVFLMREMKQIIEQGVARQDMDLILHSGARMLLFTLLVGLCTVAASYFSAVITASVTCKIREDCYRKVLSMSPQEMGRFGESTLQMRTITDATEIQILVINLMRTSLMVPIVVVCMLALIFRMNRMIFVILLSVFALTVFLLVFLGAKAKPLFELLQRKTDRYNLLMKEKITGARTIRAFGNEALEEKRTAEANEEIEDAAVRASDRIRFLSPISLVLMNWAVVIIYLASSAQLQAGMASVSDLILVFEYLAYFITCLGILPVLVNQLPRASVGIRRISELLSAPAAQESDKTASFQRRGAGSGEIVFDHVAFGYAGAVNVITDVSFTVKKGQTVGLIGATGSGKTMLMNMLMGFFRPTSGQILFDGVPLSDNACRIRISYAPQQSLVFQDTVRNNITMYDGAMTDQRVRQACEAACFDEVLEKLPEGVGTKMDQGGSNLSGGQRQRLSLARTVARDADIYIMDDAFSALDANTEKTARQRISQMLQGKTVFVVAQKIRSIQNADQIIVLKKGRIAAIGTHEQLLFGCQEYQEIYQTQQYLKEGA